jgi:hypothetical protein
VPHAAAQREEAFGEQSVLGCVDALVGGRTAGRAAAVGGAGRVDDVGDVEAEAALEGDAEPVREDLRAVAVEPLARGVLGARDEAARLAPPVLDAATRAGGVGGGVEGGEGGVDGVPVGVVGNRRQLPLGGWFVSVVVGGHGRIQAGEGREGGRVALRAEG